MSPTDLANAAGISVPYASQILSSDPKQRRDPSFPLAIHIFRKTGWRPPCLADWADEQIDALEEKMPWIPKRLQDVAA